jgi:enoyl-CoA hydratase
MSANRAGIHVSFDAGLATVTIDNPSKRNALTPESAGELVAICNSIDDDPSIGAAVIRGAGGTFCSGADLSSLADAMDDPAGEVAYRSIEGIYRAFTRFGELRVPTVAAIRGAAVGAGVNMAFAADLRVVSPESRIISGFAKLGLHPGGGHLQLVASASSREAAAALCVFNQEISGARAVELGLAWEAVGDAEVEPRATEVAATAAADPDLARKMIESLRITTPRAVPWAAALQAERAAQLWSLRRAATRRGD